MSTLFQDLRYATRMLLKSPGFTAIAILTLALGIGANTAIFSLMDAVLLQALPVKSPEQLVLFARDNNKELPNYSQTGEDDRFSFSYTQLVAFQKQTQSLSSVFAWVPLGSSKENIAVTMNGEATLANAMMVTGQFFSGLGVTPLLGRGITEQDEVKSAPRVAVISYAYWTRQFGRDPGIVGQRAELNSVPFTIVGVTPDSFNGVQPGIQPDIYLAFDDLPNLRPWSEKPDDADSIFASGHWLSLNLIGRLKPGVSQKQAGAELNILYHNMLTTDWKPAKPSDVPDLLLMSARQGMPYLREEFTQPLRILLYLVGLALLLACANVATLLLARSTARRKEITVRLAIGASRARLMRQLLTESVLLAVIGGALGLLFAEWGASMLLAIFANGPEQIALQVNPDVRLLLFTLGVSVFTGILFGLAPALRAARLDLSSVMKDSAASVTAGRERHRLGNSLVIAQVAASLVLMVGAGLFVRTLVNYEHENYGFNQQHLLLFGVDATRQGYQRQRLVNFYGGLLDRLQTLPGVTAATMARFAPFSGWSSNTVVYILGEPPTNKEKPVRWQTVGADFFRTMQIPLILGRGIERTDTAVMPRVAVVDENFVKKYLPHENPIGRRISLSSTINPTNVIEIVGVSKPAELTKIHLDSRPKAFLSYAQFPVQLDVMFYEVRTVGQPSSVTSEVRDAVRQMDSGIPLMNLRSQVEQRDDALVRERIFARLSGFFGVLALVLAVIGLYGTMSYAVSRKTQEIGIRMALGAEPSHVMRMVVGKGINLAGIGAAIGVVGALSTTRLASSLIFGLTPNDPWTLLGAAAVLLLVAMLACYIPARRAMRVDPIVALRHE